MKELQTLVEFLRAVSNLAGGAAPSAPSKPKGYVIKTRPTRRSVGVQLLKELEEARLAFSAKTNRYDVKFYLALEPKNGRCSRKGSNNGGKDKTDGREA